VQIGVNPSTLMSDKGIKVESSSDGSNNAIKFAASDGKVTVDGRVISNEPGSEKGSATFSGQVSCAKGTTGPVLELYAGCGKNLVIHGDRRVDLQDAKTSDTP
jgi:hypothetical protein